MGIALLATRLIEHRFRQMDGLRSSIRSLSDLHGPSGPLAGQL